MRWIDENLADGRVVFRMNSILTAMEAAKAGWGVGALPAFLADPDPALVRVFKPAIVANDMWLVVHPDMHRLSRVRTVISFIDLALRNAGMCLGRSKRRPQGSMGSAKSRLR